MVDPTLPLPGLSSVAGKPVIGRFDGGRLSSGGGLLVPREVERRLRVAERLAACIEDPRDPTRTVHTLADIIGFRLLAIAAATRTATTPTACAATRCSRWPWNAGRPSATCARKPPFRGWRICR